jgi:hypothetical protein
VLVTIGAAGALVARQTGEIAQELNRPRQNVVEMHETFANITTVIFGLLAINYALLLIDEFFGVAMRMRYPNGWQKVMDIRSKIFSSPLVVLSALVGLVALTITGGLGGMLVYGAQADPFTAFINKLFFQI